MRACRRFSQCIVMALCLALVASCGGDSARSPRDDAIDLVGQVTRRGNSPFSLLMFETRDRVTYWVQSSAVGDELRRLEGMPLAVTGVVVEDPERDLPVLTVLDYDLMRLPSGEKPIVGVVRTRRSNVWITDRSGVVWLLDGDFQDVLRSFEGSKVWVVGTVQRRVNSSMSAERLILVTEYGVIRR